MPSDDESTTRIVISDKPLPLGSLLLCYASVIKNEQDVKSVVINEFFQVSSMKSQDSGDLVEIEPDLLQMVESLDSTPKDVLDVIYAEILEEDEEEENDDESELQDNQEKE